MFGERRRKRENYYSDREMKFLTIITSLIKNVHSKSSRSSFPSDESNYHARKPTNKRERERERGKGLDPLARYYVNIVSRNQYEN